MNFLSEDFPLSTNERMKLALAKEPKIKPLDPGTEPTAADLLKMDALQVELQEFAKSL